MAEVEVKSATQTLAVPGVARAMNKIIDIIAGSGAFVGGAALVGCAAITFLEIILRFFFNAPTDWTLDFSIYFLLALAFLSMGYVEKVKRNIIVDVITQLLPHPTRVVWDIVITAITIFFCFLFVWLGGRYAITAIIGHETSTSVFTIPIWPIKMIIPVGGVIITLVLLRDLVVKISKLFTTDIEYKLLAKPKGFLPLVLMPAAIAGSMYLFTVNKVAGSLALLISLLFSGMPIFAGLGLVGGIGYFLGFGGFRSIAVHFPVVSYGSLFNFAIVCLPLFTLSGYILARTGTGEELYELGSKWVGHLPCGEGICTILACTIFAAISTSSVATVITIGMFALPALAARKYDKRFSYGLLAAGGLLAPMIPPAGAMIIYSAVTDESLGKLFIAGIFPGLLMASVLMIYSVIAYRHRKYERRPKASWKERIAALNKAKWGLLFPVIIIGGIYSGIFTALECAAVAVVYSFFMAFMRGRMKIKDIPNVLKESTVASVSIMVIIVGALLMGNLMIMLQIPTLTINLVRDMGLSPNGLIVAVIMLMIILGCFMEVISVQLIVIPVIYPIVIAMGFNGIWFGVVQALTAELALITPPVGLNLYAIQSIDKAKLSDVVRGVWPFFGILLAVLAVLYIVPSISTWLPSVMIKR